ncbi:MAG: lysozyme inhibitor LprI family protein [Pseudomonadota bacterium]
MRVRPLAAVLLLLVAPTTVASEDHTAFLEACIAAAGGPGRAAASTCFGQVTQSCLVNTELTTVDMVTCAGHEYDAWTQLMDRALERLRAGEPAARIASIDAAQAAWTPWRDSRCAIYTTFEGSLFRPLAVRCLADTTADRVVDLWQIERGLVSE